MNISDDEYRALNKDVTQLHNEKFRFSVSKDAWSVCYAGTGRLIPVGSSGTQNFREEPVSASEAESAKRDNLKAAVLAAKIYQKELARWGAINIQIKGKETPIALLGERDLRNLICDLLEANKAEPQPQPRPQPETKSEPQPQQHPEIPPLRLLKTPPASK